MRHRGQTAELISRLVRSQAQILYMAARTKGSRLQALTLINGFLTTTEYPARRCIGMCLVVLWGAQSRRTSSSSSHPTRDSALQITYWIFLWLPFHRT